MRGLGSYLGGDGAVLVLVEDGEGLLERLELVGRQRLQDLSTVRLREGSHRDRCVLWSLIALFEEGFRSQVLFATFQLGDFHRQNARYRLRYHLYASMGSALQGRKGTRSL